MATCCPLIWHHPSSAAHETVCCAGCMSSLISADEAAILLTAGRKSKSGGRGLKRRLLASVDGAQGSSTCACVLGCDARYCSPECRAKHVWQGHSMLCPQSRTGNGSRQSSGSGAISPAIRLFYDLTQSHTPFSSSTSSTASLHDPGDLLECAGVCVAACLAGSLDIHSVVPEAARVPGYVAPQALDEARQAFMVAILSEGVRLHTTATATTTPSSSSSAAAATNGTHHQAHENHRGYEEAVEAARGSAMARTCQAWCLQTDPDVPCMWDQVVFALNSRLVMHVVPSPLHDYAQGLQSIQPASERAHLAKQLDGLCRTAACNIEGPGACALPGQQQKPCTSAAEALCAQAVLDGAPAGSVLPYPAFDLRPPELRLARLAESVSGAGRFGTSLTCPGGVEVWALLPCAPLSSGAGAGAGAGAVDYGRVRHSCAPTHRFEVRVARGRTPSLKLLPVGDYDLSEGVSESVTVDRLAQSPPVQDLLHTMPLQQWQGMSSRARRCAGLHLAGHLKPGQTCACVRCELEGMASALDNVVWRADHACQTRAVVPPKYACHDRGVQLMALAYLYLRQDDHKNAAVALDKAHAHLSIFPPTTTTTTTTGATTAAPPPSLLHDLCIHALGATMLGMATGGGGGSGSGNDGKGGDWLRAFEAWACSSELSERPAAHDCTDGAVAAKLCPALQAVHSKLSAYHGLAEVEWRGGDEDPAARCVLRRFMAVHRQRHAYLASRPTTPTGCSTDPNLLVEPTPEAPDMVALPLHHCASPFASVAAVVKAPKVHVFLSAQPVFAPDTCAAMIAAAEHHADLHGWTTSRHYAVPTTDLPVHVVSSSPHSLSTLIADMHTVQHSDAQ
jgi:hypothetical protein